MSEFTAELIRKAASGDQDAITELYELTYSNVYKTVKSMIADEDTVLDVVQDSFIKGFQSLDQLDTPENFRAWMKRIATNKAKDYLKKKKPILFTDMANEDGEEVDFRDDCLDHNPEEVLDRKETTRLMNEILATLSEDQRLVIGMFYYEEMSVREIAETLGCSENTVKSRLNYGRKKVEVKVKELEKRGTKLYSLAPLPFLLWLFRMDAEAAEIPAGMVLETVIAECAATGATVGSAGTAAAVSAGAKAAAGAGVKALTAKIIAGVLAVSVVGSGTMLALSSNDQEVTWPTQQIVSTETISQSNTTLPSEQKSTIPGTTLETVPTAAEEVYQGITAEYQSVIGIDSAAFLKAPKSYFNGDHMAIRYYHMYHSDDFYYAYSDIDGNGMDELLIGFGSEGSIKLVDLYGFDGEQVVQLIDEPTLGDRSTLTLLSDGALYFNGSSGAADTSYEYYRVDGCILKVASPGSTAEVTDIPWIALEHTQTEQEAPPNMVDAEAAYAQVIAAMQSACSIDSQQWLSDSNTYHQQYSNLNTAMLDNYHQYGQMEFFYAYTDLDGNQTNELIIGEYGPEPRHVIRSIYTFDGTDAAEIIECGSNNIVDICADGSIMVTDGTILNGVIYLYTIDDGIYLDNIATHTFDLYTDTFQSERETLSSQDYYGKYAPNGYRTLEWNYLCG